MEWYILDDGLKRDTLIEGYESFIWTERYWAWGDFQIVTASNFENRTLFQPGVRIGMNHSYRVMTVESVSDATSEDGNKALTITGRSIEAWLDDRVAMPSMISLTATPKWIVEGTPGAIARSFFTKGCVSPVLDPKDTLPFYHSGTFLPAGTMPEPADVVSIEFEPATVYKNIQTVCETFLLGFRLVKKGDTGEIYFDVYKGDDRTSNQTVRPAVIFAQDMETLSKISTLKSIAGLKNVAYVYAQNGAMQVYADGYDASMDPGSRRILLVKADDIDLPAGTALNNAMSLRGKIELAKAREIYAFDGEIPWKQPFIYGVDYNLGDLVEERSIDGFINYVLVTEQIFVSDNEGQRTYPTTALFRIIEPGTWASEPWELHWGDVDMATHWGDV